MDVAVAVAVDVAADVVIIAAAVVIIEMGFIVMVIIRTKRCWRTSFFFLSKG